MGKSIKIVEVEANAVNEPNLKGHEEMRLASEVRSREFSEVMLTNKSLGNFNIRSAWGTNWCLITPHCLRLYCWCGCYFGSRGGFEIPWKSWNKSLVLGVRHAGEWLKNAEKTCGVTKPCSKKMKAKTAGCKTLGRSRWNKILHSHRPIDA